MYENSYIHRHKSWDAEGNICRIFESWLGGWEAVRQKTTVTDEKSLVSESPALPHHSSLLPPTLFLPLPLCTFMHSHYLLQLSAADLISPLHFIVPHFPLFLILSPYLIFFSSFLCSTSNEEDETSCDPSVLAAMLAKVPSSPFSQLSSFRLRLHPPNLRQPLFLQYTQMFDFHSCPLSVLHNSQCILGVDVCICVHIRCELKGWLCTVKRTQGRFRV